MTEKERTHDAITDILSGPYLRPMGSQFERRVSEFKDTILIGHQKILNEQNQKIEELVIENQKLKMEKSELQSRLEVWKNHLHALDLNELISYQQSAYKDELKYKETRIIQDSKDPLKTTDYIDLIRNLKSELNFERDRNLELEQLVRNLEKEIAIFRTDRQMHDKYNKDPIFAQQPTALQAKSLSRWDEYQREKFYFTQGWNEPIQQTIERGRFPNFQDQQANTMTYFGPTRNYQYYFM